MHTIRNSIFTLTLLLSLAACGDRQGAQQPTAEPDGATPFIVAVNNPLRYFTTRLLGAGTKVQLLAATGQDPALWQPTVADIGQLQQATLVILNGAGYSDWPAKISISSRQIVDSSAGLEDQFIQMEQQASHSHGPEGEHAHGAYAFTLWMDLSLAQAQAETIAGALQRAFPQHDALIAANLQALLADLSSLDSQYQQWASAAGGRRIIFSHPVYQYFERRYQLAGTSLHWEPDQMPTREQWEHLQALTDGDDNALLIWEATPLVATTDRLQQLGVAYAVLDPGAGQGDTDWLALQQRNLASLSQATMRPSNSVGKDTQAP